MFTKLQNQQSISMDYFPPKLTITIPEGNFEPPQLTFTCSKSIIKTLVFQLFLLLTLVFLLLDFEQVKC